MFWRVLIPDTMRRGAGGAKAVSRNGGVALCVLFLGNRVRFWGVAMSRALRGPSMTTTRTCACCSSAFWVLGLRLSRLPTHAVGCYGPWASFPMALDSLSNMGRVRLLDRGAAL